MYLTLNHDIACLKIHYSDHGITRIQFTTSETGGSKGLYIAGDPPTKVLEAVNKLELFLNGGDARFDLSVLQFTSCTDYQRRVLRTVSRIRRGTTLSYGEVASMAGGSPRSVACALSRNPFPIIIPCHRVIRSDCTPGGYQGGAELKKLLLEREGVKFS